MGIIRAAYPRTFLMILPSAARSSTRSASASKRLSFPGSLKSASAASDLAGSSAATSGSASSTALCVALLLACMLVTYPVAEAGFIDDWSYVWTAKVLAQTGHLVFNGWSTAMLGWQAYLGALFAKMFGYSCTTVRMSVAFVSLLSCALLHRILLRLGHSAWNASIATLTLFLSATALPLQVSFMSDLPGLLAVLACLYSCLRALQARTDRSTLVWLAAAAAANVLLGTARQISWLGALILVPSAAYLIRQRRGVPLTAAVLWLASVVAIAGSLLWFRHQPYSVPEPLLMLHRGQLPGIGHAAIAACFLLLPMLVAFLWPPAQSSPLRKPGPHALRLAGGFAGGIALALLLPTLYGDTAGVVLPFSAVPVALQILWMGFAGASVMATAGAISRAIIYLRKMPQAEGNDPAGLSAHAILVLTLPYAAFCIVLIVTRAVLWSRYLLSLLPMLLILLLEVHRLQRPVRRLPLVSAGVVAAFAFSAILVTHDLFASQRARVLAEQEYRATGLPRTALDAGLDQDGWVQIQLTGYVNDFRLRKPAAAYRPRIPPSIPLPCQSWSLPLTPAIDPRYALTESANICLRLTALPPVHYRTWLPPHEHTIYIGQFRSTATPLAVKRP